MAGRVPRRGLLAPGLALALAAAAPVAGLALALEAGAAPNGGAPDTGSRDGESPVTRAALAAAEPEPAPERAAEPLFSVLAYHDFDGARADTGPDTFRVWETTRGRVERSTLFRWSGDVAVEIRDAAGDGDFPELQGYFEARAAGRLFVHFAFLVTDPAEPFNVALAGPAYFTLRRDGIAFWLQGRDGVLRHVSDSIPKPLLELAPFTWYQVDLLCDLDAGRYDLALYEEGLEEPKVALTDQPNAAAQPGSKVDKFSFIGDTGEDVSRVVYYVDDILIGADAPVELPPFVGPGRRRLFIELLPAGGEAAASGPPGAVAGAGGEPGAGGETVAADAERAGDAALLAGDPAAAKGHYQRALEAGGDPTPLLLKLADAYFLLGDLPAEKALREKIYGSLDPQTQRDDGR